MSRGAVLLARNRLMPIPRRVDNCGATSGGLKPVTSGQHEVPARNRKGVAAKNYAAFSTSRASAFIASAAISNDRNREA